MLASTTAKTKSSNYDSSSHCFTHKKIMKLYGRSGRNILRQARYLSNIATAEYPFLPHKSPGLYPPHPLRIAHPAYHSLLFPERAARWSFTARIEGAHSDRAASASKKDRLAAPALLTSPPRYATNPPYNGVRFDRCSYDHDFPLHIRCAAYPGRSFLQPDAIGLPVADHLESRRDDL